MSIALHRNPEFSRLSVECMAKFYGMAKPCIYRKHELIVRQNTEADGLYLVQTGIAKVSIESDEGRSAILNLLRPGDLFGEIALIDGGKRLANVVALEAVQLLRLARDDYMSLTRDHPELSNSLARYICRRIRLADQKIGELSLLGLQERLCRQLRELAIVDESGRLVVPAAVSQQDIADMIGASRERVNSALRALSQSGEVDMQGREIVLRETSEQPSKRLSACM